MKYYITRLDGIEREVTKFQFMFELWVFRVFVGLSMLAILAIVYSGVMLLGGVC